ncbi:MAG: hypothetical protein ACJ735_06440 [Actinomycetes bacterium]
MNPLTRARALLVAGAAVIAAATVLGTQQGGPAAAAAGGASGTGNWRTVLTQHTPLVGQRAAENDHVQMAPVDATIYAPNTAANLLSAVQAAGKLGLAPGSHPWKERGPFGVDFIPGIANGGEKLETIGGIGTTLAADPTNPNVAYFGTHGGLYVTRDGGKTLQNLTDGKLPHVPVGAVAVDPQDAKTIYVGTGVSLLTISDDAIGVGMYVSHDGGKTFVRPAHNIAAYGVNAILATAQGAIVGTNAGVYRSTDHGASFARVHLPTNATHTADGPDPFGNWVQTVVARPEHPNEVTIDVGFAYGKYPGPDGKPVATGNGLYRSTDSGAHFAYFSGNAGLASPLSDATSDPLGRISLAYGTAPGQDQTLWALVSDGGRARGASERDLPDSPDPFGLGLDPGKTSEMGGLYRSLDDGATWSLQAIPETLLTALNSTQAGLAALDYAPGVQSSYNNWVATDPIDPNRVYIGLEEAFEGEYGAFNPSNIGNPTNTNLTTKFQVMERYADVCGFYSTVLYSEGGLITGRGGQPGTPCPSQVPLYGGPSTHPDQHSVAVVTLPGGGERMYSGNDGGLFVQDASTELDSVLGSGNITGFGNAKWTADNSVSTTLPYHANFWSHGRLLVALQDNGAAYVEPNGHGVEICGGDSMEVLPGPTDDSLFCTHGGDTVDYVTGNGKTTYDASPLLSSAFGIAPLAQDPLNRNHLIAAGRDVQELTNPHPGGLINTGDWATVFDAGQSSVSRFPGSNCPGGAAKCDWQASAAAVHGNTTYVAICGVCRANFSDTSFVHATLVTNYQPGCTRAIQSKKCWHKTKGIGLPKRRIAGVAFDPTDPKTVYVGLQDLSLIGYNPAINGIQRVMVSHDGGDHFTDISGNLPKANVTDVIVRNNQPIISTDVGVFTAPKGSTTWVRLGTGLPGVRVADVRLDSTGRYMVVPMYGRGAWVYDFGQRAQSGSGVVPPISGNSGKSLATTGLPPALALVGLLFVLVGLLTRRQHRRSLAR